MMVLRSYNANGAVVVVMKALLCSNVSVEAELALPSSAGNRVTRWPFYAHLCGAMFCLLMSSGCHLLACPLGARQVNGLPARGVAGSRTWPRGRAPPPRPSPLGGGGLPSSLPNLSSPSSGHHPVGITPPTFSHCCRHRSVMGEAGEVQGVVADGHGWTTLNGVDGMSMEGRNRTQNQKFRD
jgi:hypothetical protein